MRQPRLVYVQTVLREFEYHVCAYERKEYKNQKDNFLRPEKFEIQLVYVTLTFNSAIKYAWQYEY